MDRETVMKHVIQTVEKVQEISGRDIGTIDADTRPIGDAAGFDSLNAIEATVALLERLGHDLPDENLFISEDGNRSLTIAEVTDNLCETIQTNSKTI